VFGRPPLEPDDPGEADQPLDLEPDDEDEDEEPPEVDDELPDDELLDVEPLPDATVVVAVDRAAIAPVRPRNVAAESAAATIRDRLAAWRRFGLEGRGVVRGGVRSTAGQGSSGAPSQRNPGVRSMSSPRGVALVMGGSLDSNPEEGVPVTCAVPVKARGAA
jgi:hypothetical protein